MAWHMEPQEKMRQAVLSGITWRQRINVADTAHRLDALRAVGMRAEFAPHVTDVRVDAPVEGQQLAAQYVLRNLLATYDIARRAQQGCQQVILGGRQYHRLIAAPHDASADIHHQIAHTERLTAGQ